MKLSYELEQQRLAALNEYAIDYGLREKQFDEITKLAAIVCNKPIALITFLDEKTQWIKSDMGFSATCTDRELAFCNKTIQGEEILEIENAETDKRFNTNPFVTGEPYIRFYAGAPLTTPDGLQIGSLCVIDTKPGKLTEQQREALTTLSHSVIRLLELKKRQRELIEEKQRAEEAGKAKASFLSTMSHEIRTPLNGISGIAHILMEEEHLPHQAEYIRTLKFSANHLMAIVNDILDFSKIEAGGIAIENIPFNLSELLSEIKNANLLRAQDKQIKLKLKRDDELPEFVAGDPVRLSQILNNLVNNAVKFTDCGEVVMDAQVEQLDSTRVQVRFAVKDTGIGIPKEKQERLFEQFCQVDSSVTRRYGGTGLGLAITKRLLEMQGSAIHLKSEAGAGSEFSFVLSFDIPEGVQTSARKPTTLSDEPHSFEGATILLAEDNEANTLIAKKFLKNWGARITHVTIGKDAVDLVQRKTFDMVLMDLQMPVMDGYEATSLIRKAGHSPFELPIIALTASAIHTEREQALEVGMNDLITKPFSPIELHTKLKKYLYQRTLR
jgi:signal transduction histidine kinase